MSGGEGSVANPACVMPGRLAGAIIAWTGRASAPGHRWLLLAVRGDQGEGGSRP